MGGLRTGAAGLGGRCFRRTEPSARLNTKEINERSSEPVTARRGESARSRAVGSLGLCILFLLGGPGRLAAQGGASYPFPRSADNGWPASRQTASLTGSFPAYRLLPEESRDHDRWLASTDLAMDPPLTLGLDPLRPTAALSLRGTELTSSTQACPAHRLLSADSSECDRLMAFLAMDVFPRFDQAQDEV